MKATWTVHGVYSNTNDKKRGTIHVLTIGDNLAGTWSYSGRTKRIAVKKAKANLIKDLTFEMRRLNKLANVITKLKA